MTLWPLLLDIQELWETDELEPPPDWEDPKREEPSLTGRAEPDPGWELLLPYWELLLPDWELLDPEE